MVGLTALVFLMGGSSRSDVWSLPILRPVAVISLFYGIWSLSRADIARHRFLFGMSVVVVALIVGSLIPLPPLVWTALPGREVIVAIDAAVGLSGTWRPVSMAPDLTWNALFSLAVPLAILANGVRLSAREHRVASITALVGGGLTMALAFLQLASGGDMAFYLYRSSSFGEPSGLFANRNHEALFLATLLPLLGFVLATSRGSGAGRYLVFAGVLLTIAFIIVLGSRAGLALGSFGLVAFFVVGKAAQGRPAGRAASRVPLMLGVAATIVVAAGAIFAGSARSLQRLVESDNRQELRYVIWPIIKNALPQFLPAGTGVGTYEPVFQMMEPDAILRPTYSNHAHNDWLEVALTVGAPGILLMAVAVIAFAVATARVWSLPRGASKAMGATGLVIISIAAIGSVIDYPLRTPIMSALFALSCVWVAASLHSRWNDNERGPDPREASGEELRK